MVKCISREVLSGSHGELFRTGSASSRSRLQFWHSLGVLRRHRDAKYRQPQINTPTWRRLRKRPKGNKNLSLRRKTGVWLLISFHTSSPRKFFHSSFSGKSLHTPILYNGAQCGDGKSCKGHTGDTVVAVGHGREAVFFSSKPHKWRPTSPHRLTALPSWWWW